MVNGSEKPLCNKCYSDVLTWDDKDNVLIREVNRIFKLNINDGSTETIADDVQLAAGSFPYLFCYQYGFTPKVKNLADMSEKAVEGLKYEAFCSLASMQDNENIIIEAAPKSNEFIRDLIVLNLKTLKYKILKGNDDKHLLRFSWYDNETFCVTVKSDDTNDEETCTINVSEME